MPRRERTTGNRRDQQVYRDRQRRLGRTQVLLTVPERYAEPLRALAREMRDRDPDDVPISDADTAGRAAAAEARVATLAAGRARDRQRAWAALHGRRTERDRARWAEQTVTDLRSELEKTLNRGSAKDRTIGRVEGERDQAREERDDTRKERDSAKHERDQAREERDAARAQVPSKKDQQALAALRGKTWRGIIARRLLGV